jgi:hypothetical protein
MQAGREDRLNTAAEVARQLELLADVEPTDAPFLSCALDLGAAGTDDGPPPWRLFLDGAVRQLRQDVPPHQREDLEAALARLQALLADPPQAQAGGLVLYLRGEGGGRFELSMQVAARVSNALGFYPVPDLMPLVRLLDGGGRHLLVLLRKGWLQLQELDLGAASVHHWMALPADRPLTKGLGLTQRIIADVQRKLWRAGVDGFYLAGDEGRMSEFRDCLPGRLGKSLLGSLPLPPHKAPEDLVQAIAAADRKRQWERSAPELARLVRALRVGGAAAGGGPAVREGLRSGRAGLLLMERGYRSPPLPLCRSCGAPVLSAAGRNDCACCGSPTPQPLDLRVELLRTAVQQSVPVQLVESPELAYLGGVGCLFEPGLQAVAVSRSPSRANSEAVRLVA